MTFSLRAWTLIGLSIWSGLFVPTGRADELLPADRPIPEVIDHYINSLLEQRGVTAAPAADDSTVIRRITLDLAGRIPTTAEAQAYVADSSPDKLVQLVDRLFTLPEYALHQRNELDLMLAGEQRLDNAWRDYLLSAVRENRPWDVMFREMMLSEEAEKSPGALALIKAKAKDVDQMTGDISSLFFGVNITCAKCHDHPLVPDWLQDHYYGFQSFFNRTYITKANFLAEYDEGDVKFKTTSGESKSAQLMFLTGTVVPEPEMPSRSEAEKKKLKELLASHDEKKTPPPAPEFSRREVLVNLSLQPGEREFFSKAIVNRLWHRLFGWGMVNPVDQMHSGNPPSHPDLLDWLARDLVEHGYDLQRLIRGMVLSEAYRRSSVWESGERPYPDLFAVANVKPLTPRQLGMALLFATANPERLPSDGKPETWASLVNQYDGRANGFAANIEAPSEDFQVSVSEALLFSNNDRIAADYLGNSQEKLLSQLEKSEDRAAGLQTAAWSVLSRSLNDEELKLLGDYLAAREDRLNEGWKQVVWAFITSPEFRFNH